VIQLAFGYNGLGRITGNESGGAGGGGGVPGGVPGGAPVGAPAGVGGAGGFGGGAFGGGSGITRLANDQFGGFIAWWLPAALLGLVAGVWLARRARRTDPRWASLILWGGWALGTAGIFSFASGIVHTYYTVALAPGVAALAAIALPGLWRSRKEPVARLLLAAFCALTALTAFLLLGRATGWLPWLRWSVLAVGLVAAAALVGVGVWAPLRGRRMAAGIATAALAAGVAGPLAWSLQTIGTTHTGSIPTTGPASAQAAGFAGFAGGRRDRDRFDAEAFGGQLPGGAGQIPGGGGQIPGGGGPGGAESADSAVISLLTSGAAGYTWVAAASSSMTAGPLQLGSNAPVMSIGGFSGGDQAITLAQFKAYVAAGKIHYYVGGGMGGGGFGGRGRADGSSSIASWVTSTFTAKTVGNATVYDLTAPKA
jgi:hypothetical protein